MQLDRLDLLPLWGVLLGTLVLVLVAVEGGFRLGRYKSVHAPDKEAPLAAMVAASLGLVGLLLAFTFGLATSRFDARRQAFLEEVNAIGTAYLRAQFLPEPDRTNVRDLLHQYVDVRVEGVRSGAIRAAIQQSEALHGQMWAHAVAAFGKNPRSVAIGLFVQSLNEVLDHHTERVVAGLRSRIPTVIWIVLYGTTALGMVLFGYHLGLNDRRRSIVVPAFALVFAVVLLLIADLDRPREGLITVNQEAMEDLRRTMAR